MTRIATYLIVAVAIAVVGVSATSAQVANDVASIAAAGKFDGQLYENRAAGFSILVPGGWSLLSENDNKATAEQGRLATRELVSGTKPENRSDLEISIAKTAVLFQANSKPTRAGAGKALMSAGIEILSRPMTKEEYLENNRDLVLKNPAIRPSKAPTNVTVGQTQFATFEVTGEANGKNFTQRYMVTIHRGRAIFFVFTLLDGSYDALINNSLASFKLLK